MDPYELNLGLHHVDTSSAGQKHALNLQPSGYYTVTFQQICLEECQMNITRSMCECIDQRYAFRNRVNDSGCTAKEMETCVLPRSRPVALVECEKLCGIPLRGDNLRHHAVLLQVLRTHGGRRVSQDPSFFAQNRISYVLSWSLFPKSVYFLKLKLLMTSRNVEVVHFIPALTLTQLLGVVGGYMGFWMELSTLKVLWRFVMAMQGCLTRGKSRLGQRPLALASVRFALWLVLVVVAGACGLVCLASSVYDVRSFLQYRTTVLFEQQPLSGSPSPQ
ncbi:hypothetical protein HPB48_024306 [Haemaphysalis longicornis]|uniref:Uncharacterized protein n=1 Tax=Haemaphysalis longicornis TaxID=44386 RepID=A0A9J6H6I9_HAELO|nr:hypothetical protein HPB48_024306 [Haemaphysalis longicornis]